MTVTAGTGNVAGEAAQVKVTMAQKKEQKPEEKPDAPSTGDTSDAGLWLTILVASAVLLLAAALTLILLCRKNRQ